MRIKAIASAVPSWVVDNATIRAWSGIDGVMLDKKIGISQRHFLGHDETGVDLAESACRTLCSREPAFEFGKVGLLAFVTQNPDYKLPHNAGLLQHRLGLPTSTAAFDINLGCSGYVYALGIARAMMQVENIDQGLVITCDPYSKVMSPQDKDTIGLFGDAATVTWLASDGAGSIGLGDYGTDGAGAASLIVESGGAAHPFNHLDGAPVSLPTTQQMSLKMNGRAIFNFMMARVPQTVERCLARNKLGPSQVDLFVFHQASRFLLETLTAYMGLPPEKVVVGMEETGNTVSSSIPLQLERLMLAEALAGKTVLACGFGVGLSWCSNILRFGAES
jgi:3-oxoacyl-[acyl-carrier-protein] synthase III